MTFDDDFVRLHLTVGTRTIPCRELGLEWPPPERITSLNGVEFAAPLVRVRCSDLSDEQRSRLTHVARAAEYRYEDEAEVRP